MEECAHRIQILPAKENQYFFWQIKGHNSGTEKVVKSKIQLVLPFMVPELVHKFQMLYLTGT